jgi:hypothetical protein
MQASVKSVASAVVTLYGTMYVGTVSRIGDYGKGEIESETQACRRSSLYPN